MKILATGLTGLIGSRIAELLGDTYEFTNLSRSNGVDITHIGQVQQAINSSDAEIVLHLAAYTNVKQAELDKSLNTSSDAWKINVIGTQNVAQTCQEKGKKLIYVSTDMVLGGDTAPEGGFKEDASQNPLSWYAVTKFEAEKKVQEMKTPWLITRLAYPYRAKFEKTDFVRFFIEKFSQGQPLTVLTDRIISPTFIDDVANAFDVLIKNNATGIYHTTGSQALSIFDAAKLITKEFNFDENLVKPITRAEFLVGRPPEPANSALNIDKLKSLGVHMKSFEEGLKEIKKQMQ